MFTVHMDGREEAQERFSCDEIQLIHEALKGYLYEYNHSDATHEALRDIQQKAMCLMLACDGICITGGK